MLQGIHLYINNILNYCGFRISNFPKRIYSRLLTEFSNMRNESIIVIPEFIKKFANEEWELIIDETINGKYGLKDITRKLKILNHGGYCQGYKVVLFMLNKGNWRIPIGFGLYHKESESVSELAMQFCGILRNEYGVRPEIVIADGAYDVDKLIKRLTDYGWALLFRCRSSRKLSKTSIKILIPRGYGEAKGKIKNGTKVKMFRRKDRFYICNRMLMIMEKAVKKYEKRWKIEEIFRVLKSCIKINGCQQHSIIAQEIFIWMCLIAFAVLVYITKESSGSSIYKTFENVISGKYKINVKDIERLFRVN